LDGFNWYHTRIKSNLLVLWLANVDLFLLIITTVSTASMRVVVIIITILSVIPSLTIYCS